MRRRQASSTWQQRLQLAPTRRDRFQLLRYVMIDIDQRTRRTLSVAVDSESVRVPPASSLAGSADQRQLVIDLIVQLDIGQC